MAGMQSGLKRAVLGVLIAIAITAAMDATGFSAFSALPLAPLMAIFWYVDRLSRREMGFTWGRLPHHGLALVYPVVVMGVIALIAAGTGAIDLTQADWRKAILNLALVTASTVLVATITEEGFFRGWLWGSLARGGKSPIAILLWTSIAFTLWHISAVVLSTGFDVPAAQVPVFLLNAAVLGAVWGLLRWLSGSIVVTSVSHGLWNGLAYVLFGFGTRHGALGIENTALYGPEVGMLGLVVNAAVMASLWLWCKRDLKGELDRSRLGPGSGSAS